jgi:hypothetical protein
VDGKGDVGNGSMFDIVRQLNPPDRKLYVVNLTDPLSQCHQGKNLHNKSQKTLYKMSIDK